MTQMMLPLDDEPRRLSGTHDPPSSAAAAEAMIVEGHMTRQRQEVYQAVLAFGPGTAREIAAASGIDRYTISRRCPELRAMGYVEEGPIRACRAGGRASVEWRAIPQCGA